MDVPRFQTEITIPGDQLLLDPSGVSPALRELGFLAVDYAVERSHVPGGMGYSLTPQREPVVDDELHALIRSPLGWGDNHMDATTEKMRRLVNTRSAVYQDVMTEYDIDDVPGINPADVQDNIHTILDILESGDRLGWVSEQIDVYSADGLAPSCYSLLPALSVSELRRIVDDCPNVDPLHWSWLARQSEDQRREVVGKWFGGLQEASREQLYRSYVEKTFINTVVEHNDAEVDVYIPKGNLPKTISGSLGRIKLATTASLESFKQAHATAYFRTSTDYYAGIPELRWTVDQAGQREFVMNAPRVETDADNRIIVTDNMLGALLLANMVMGPIPTPHDIDPTQDLSTVSDYLRAENHKYPPYFRAALLPWTILRHSKMILTQPVIAGVEAAFDS